MATFFLSYRRTDSPQACRVYDWLAARFGEDALFMDVEAIPAAVSFPEYIKEAIANCRIMIVLIGAGWQARIKEDDDPVRMEIEGAFEHEVPVLPLLIGATKMPTADELPASIAGLAVQNAARVGVLHDFHTHMQAILPEIESIVGRRAVQNEVIATPDVITEACGGIRRFLADGLQAQLGYLVDVYLDAEPGGTQCITVQVHRVTRLAELLDLHLILSFWAGGASYEHAMAGSVLRLFEQTPVVPHEYFPVENLELKLRRSDEDARQVWKMITDKPLQLSLTYVATLSPRR